MHRTKLRNHFSFSLFSRRISGAAMSWKQKHNQCDKVHEAARSSGSIG